MARDGGSVAVMNQQGGRLTAKKIEARDRLKKRKADEFQNYPKAIREADNETQFERKRGSHEEDVVATRPRRTVRKPCRLESGEDDAALRMAIQASLMLAQPSKTSMEEAPVMRPTSEEWKDPLQYVQKIWATGERYGIVKIIPPAEWKPQDRFNPSKHSIFETKEQSMWKLQEGRAFGEGCKYSLEGYEEVAKKWIDEYHRAKRYRFNDTLHEERLKLERKSASLADGGCSSSGTTDIRRRSNGSPSSDSTKLQEVQDLGYGTQYPYDLAYERALERCYWRHVKAGAGDALKIVIDYGSDIDSSLFPQLYRSEKDNWELAGLVYNTKSLLKQLPDHINGVTKPWCYVGTLFASFCWHTEDHFLASINYMHQGSAKSWYGVSGNNATKFEDACRKNVPQLLKNEPDMLYRLTLALPPDVCLQYDVPVTHTVQHAGEVIVTFPRAYHSGFSHGFNVAEAVNFATPDWLKWGRLCLTSYFNGRAKRLPLFSQDLMIYKLAKSLINTKGSKTSKSLQWTTSHDIKCLLEDLAVIIKDEEFQRRRLLDLEDHEKDELTGSVELLMNAFLKSKEPSPKKKRSIREVYAGVPKYTDELLTKPCSNCKCFPFFSELRCEVHPTERACPGCSKGFCTNCDLSTKYLNVLVRPSEIQVMYDEIKRILQAIEESSPDIAIDRDQGTLKPHKENWRSEFGVDSNNSFSSTSLLRKTIKTLNRSEGKIARRQKLIAS